MYIILILEIDFWKVLSNDIVYFREVIDERLLILVVILCASIVYLLVVIKALREILIIIFGRENKQFFQNFLCEYSLMGKREKVVVCLKTL